MYNKLLVFQGVNAECNLNPCDVLNMLTIGHRNGEQKNVEVCIEDIQWRQLDRRLRAIEQPSKKASYHNIPCITVGLIFIIVKKHFRKRLIYLYFSACSNYRKQKLKDFTVFIGFVVNYQLSFCYYIKWQKLYVCLFSKNSQANYFE